MLPKKGTDLPKKGTDVHPAGGASGADASYSRAVAAALRQELGETHRAVKAAMRWTGASERTVKYWFSGSRGPSGKHLIALARHSDAVLRLILQRAGRQDYAAALSLMNAQEALKDVQEAVHLLLHGKRELLPSESRPLSQLREENRRLRRLVVNLSLDKQLLQFGLRREP